MRAGASSYPGLMPLLDRLVLGFIIEVVAQLIVFITWGRIYFSIFLFLVALLYRWRGETDTDYGGKYIIRK